MTEYQLALYFWSTVLVAAVAAPFLFALVDSVVHGSHRKGNDGGSARDSHPSLPSMPSCPSSPA
jgi:hypothetical protein